MNNDQQKVDLTKALLGGPSFYSRPSSYLHSFYLYSIGEAEQYTDWLDTIRNCSETDVVKIHINSPGGDLLTTIQLVRALQETMATVICSVEGQCMSAATLIFLQADMVEISDHSMFMFHNYSGGTIGKGGEMYDNIVYERKWSEQLFRDVYKDFLTEEEISSMLDNKDIWMNSEEVTNRIKQKAEKLNMELQEEEVIVEEEPKPKRTRRRKTTEEKS